MNESKLQDTGDFLEVPEDQRLEVDDPEHEEPNEDEFVDYAPITPDGDYVELSTADEDEPVGIELDEEEQE